MIYSWHRRITVDVVRSIRRANKSKLDNRYEPYRKERKKSRPWRSESHDKDKDKMKIFLEAEGIYTGDQFAT